MFRSQKEEEKLDLRKNFLKIRVGIKEAKTFPSHKKSQRTGAQRQRTDWSDLTILAPDDVGNGDASNL